MEKAVKISAPKINSAQINLPLIDFNFSAKNMKLYVQNSRNVANFVQSFGHVVTKNLKIQQSVTWYQVCAGTSTAASFL